MNTIIKQVEKEIEKVVEWLEYAESGEAGIDDAYRELARLREVYKVATQA